MLLSFAGLEAAFCSEIQLSRPSSSWIAGGTPHAFSIPSASGLANLEAGTLGWFEFGFDVDVAGWQRLLVDANPSVSKTEFYVDGNKMNAYSFAMVQAGQFQIGWIWLAEGRHTLRVQHLFWTGFPGISSIRFERRANYRVHPFRIGDHEASAFELDRCAPLKIETASSEEPIILSLSFTNEKMRSHVRFVAPVSTTPITSRIDVPCSTPGNVEVKITSQSGVAAKLSYAVFDTASSPSQLTRGELVEEIDASAREPDFTSGSTRVVKMDAGSYRESSDRGSTPFVRHPDLNPRPSWFAYKVDRLIRGQPYLLEVEYPDDAPRVFVVSSEDENTAGYSQSFAVESGAIWMNSSKSEAASRFIWPTDNSIRILITNVHSGMRAAVSKIRVFRAMRTAARRDRQSSNHRQFGIWSEEGLNYRSVVGASKEVSSTYEAVDRYLQLVADAGADVFVPTVVVYDTQMYPSAFQRTFRMDDRDELLPILLGARKYGIEIVPQLHPRADEILWSARNRVGLEARVALSRTGQRHFIRADGVIERPPYYNPLNPEVQNWYVDTITELAARYAAHSNFKGVDLRVSAWQNPGLNNFISLDWGYDARTVSQFYEDVGIGPPSDLDLTSDDQRSAAARYEELSTRHYAKWVDWRCEKVARLFAVVAEKVQSIRPDLKIYLSLFALSLGRRLSQKQLKEAGIDLERLGKIEGIAIIDAQHQHGAREEGLSWRADNQLELEEGPILSGGRAERSNIIMPMQYIEIPGSVIARDKVGLRGSGERPFTSASSEPAGRLALKRFALALGLKDAFLLGDGGNGYVFGDAARASFAREFKMLPRRPFRRVLSRTDAVVVRESDDIFYAVNLRPTKSKVTIRMSGAPPSVTRLTTGQIAIPNEGKLNLMLDAYEVQVFKTNQYSRIEQVE